MGADAAGDEPKLTLLLAADDADGAKGFVMVNGFSVVFVVPIEAFDGIDVCRSGICVLRALDLSEDHEILVCPRFPAKSWVAGVDDFEPSKCGFPDLIFRLCAGVKGMRRLPVPFRGPVL